MTTTCSGACSWRRSRAHAWARARSCPTSRASRRGGSPPPSTALTRTTATTTRRTTLTPAPRATFGGGCWYSHAICSTRFCRTSATAVATVGAAAAAAAGVAGVTVAATATTREANRRCTTPSSWTTQRSAPPATAPCCTCFPACASQWCRSRRSARSRRTSTCSSAGDIPSSPNRTLSH
jgi:hypothetical protein